MRRSGHRECLSGSEESSGVGVGGDDGTRSVGLSERAVLFLLKPAGLGSITEESIREHCANQE